MSSMRWMCVFLRRADERQRAYRKRKAMERLGLTAEALARLFGVHHICYALLPSPVHAAAPAPVPGAAPGAVGDGGALYLFQLLLLVLLVLQVLRVLNLLPCYRPCKC
ncbi:uncharacterized protein DSM5745_09913 [Aspergillus mulundensis]|uniref:Uncharacterized protein n=1 Tax=Aspergillus mulundensis TaxID=1810919 RepID=A0A3D8QRS7_9EURO|nr:hypothetical protein DSM5745_09913 [Aspergillus mulundensis]RDW64502.1 hypothetical protein DSM5745_09913 [Aspergillus mulundensis]